MIVVSALLVLVAIVTFLLGVFGPEGQASAMTWISMGASIIAFLALLLSIMRGRKALLAADATLVEAVSTSEALSIESAQDDLLIPQQADASLDDTDLGEFAADAETETFILGGELEDAADAGPVESVSTKKPAVRKKSAAKKAGVKKAAAKPAKKTTAKPAAPKKSAAKPAAKKAAAKKTTAKPAAPKKATAKKSAAKPAAKKPAAKKAAAKKSAAKPAVKKAAAKKSAAKKSS